MKQLLKTTGFAVVAAAVIAMAQGCATVSYSSPGSLDGIVVNDAGGPARQQIIVDTSGLYVLWVIPVGSGDLRWDPYTKNIRGGVRWFTDMVSFDDLQKALLNIADARNCDLADVVYSDSDASFAGPDYEGLVGAFFGASTMSVSAVLVPRETKVQNGGAK